MSQRNKRGTCQGTYPPIQADGLRYFHACPPAVDPGTGPATKRADKRDENVTVDAAGRFSGIRAEGKGVSAAEIAAES